MADDDDDDDMCGSVVRVWVSGYVKLRVDARVWPFRSLHEKMYSST